jgi:hypothetical protein
MTLLLDSSGLASCLKWLAQHVGPMDSHAYDGWIYTYKGQGWRMDRDMLSERVQGKSRFLISINDPAQLTHFKLRWS